MKEIVLKIFIVVLTTLVSCTKDVTPSITIDGKSSSSSSEVDLSAWVDKVTISIETGDGNSHWKCEQVATIIDGVEFPIVGEVVLSSGELPIDNATDSEVIVYLPLYYAQEGVYPSPSTRTITLKFTIEPIAQEFIVTIVQQKSVATLIVNDVVATCIGGDASTTTINVANDVESVSIPLKITGEGLTTYKVEWMGVIISDKIGGIATTGDNRAKLPFVAGAINDEEINVVLNIPKFTSDENRVVVVKFDSRNLLQHIDVTCNLTRQK